MEYNVEIENALNRLVKRFHELSQRDQHTGNYNFYVQHFRDQADGIDDAMSNLVDDQTGYFEEFALDQMRDEVLALVRAICSAEVYTTFFAYYNPAAAFQTREEYTVDAIARAKKARTERMEHYKQLADHYKAAQ